MSAFIFSSLHSNQLLASLQLLYWLLFHPSCWRQWVATIDSSLPPDFALFMLSRQQWQQPQLRHLLFSIYVVEPLILTVMAGWGLLILDLDLLIQRGLVYAVISSIVGRLVSGITISVAFSLIASISNIFLISGSFFWLTDPQTRGIVLLCSGVLAVSLASSVLCSIVIEEDEFPRSRWFQPIVKIILGLLRFVAIMLVSVLGMLWLTSIMASGTGDHVVTVALLSLVLAMGFEFGYFTHHWRWATAISLTSGMIIFGLSQWSPLAETLESAIVGSLFNGLFFTWLFALPYLLLKPLAGMGAGIVAGLLGSGGIYYLFWSLTSANHQPNQLWLWLLVAGGLGLTQHWWRPVLFYPGEMLWNRILYHLERRMNHDIPPPHILVSATPRPAEIEPMKVNTCWLRWHSAFWDEQQWLPCYGLEKYLVLVNEQQPQLGEKFMAQLSQTRQRWATQTAQIELGIRSLQDCTHLAAIQTIYHRLPTERSSHRLTDLLSRFGSISRDVAATLARENFYTQRHALIQSINLVGEIRQDLRFFPISDPRWLNLSEQWIILLKAHLEQLAEQIQNSPDIDNPYITGVPLRSQDAKMFVGRRNEGMRIEQLLQDKNTPPLLLYGQRRIGKTSLLYQLGNWLTESYVPMLVDLQGPVSSATSYQNFFYNMSREMRKSAGQHRYRQLTLPPLKREALQADPFTGFDEWLDLVEESVEGRTVLLTLDEFEALANAFTRGPLTPDLILGMFRHQIQHRARFRLLMAGATSLDKFPGWSGYLINLETIHLRYLAAEEAMKLIELPLAEFSLRYTTAAKQGILELTRGHPALIQLVCKEIVRLNNEQQMPVKNLVQPADVEVAARQALTSGQTYFNYLAEHPPQVLKLLRVIAAQGEGVALRREQLAQWYSQPEVETVLARLVQCELLENIAPDYYRFQVELIRRWFV